jgi:hypothetical protein
VLRDEFEIGANLNCNFLSKIKIHIRCFQLKIEAASFPNPDVSRAALNVTENQTTEKLHFDSTVLCQQELLQLRLHLFLPWQNRGDSLAGVVFGQAFLHENLVHHHRLQIHQISQSKYRHSNNLAVIAQGICISFFQTMEIFRGYLKKIM